jgi:hypothetical protein
MPKILLMKNLSYRKMLITKTRMEETRRLSLITNPIVAESSSSNLLRLMPKRMKLKQKKIMVSLKWI